LLLHIKSLPLHKPLHSPAEQVLLLGCLSRHRHLDEHYSPPAPASEHNYLYKLLERIEHSINHSSRIKSSTQPWGKACTTCNRRRSSTTPSARKG
jgi:hypothetical protein